MLIEKTHVIWQFPAYQVYPSGLNDLMQLELRGYGFICFYFLRTKQSQANKIRRKLNKK